MIDLELQENQIASVMVQYNNQQYQLTPKAVIVASGGFESNRDWLAESWGEAQNMSAETPSWQNLVDEAKRQTHICNSCRYCEGFCDVFPAMHQLTDSKMSHGFFRFTALLQEKNKHYG